VEELSYSTWREGIERVGLEIWMIIACMGERGERAEGRGEHWMDGMGLERLIAVSGPVCYSCMD
jgi:hypothetical protein